MTDLETSIRVMIRRIVREEIKAAIDELRGDEYLSTRAAAELADVAEGTIRRWIKCGRLPRHNAGRVVRVLRTELEQLLRSGPIAANDDDLSPEELAQRDFG